jgi:hypothetical protein
MQDENYDFKLGLNKMDKGISKKNVGTRKELEYDIS